VAPIAAAATTLPVRNLLLKSGPRLLGEFSLMATETAVQESGASPAGPDRDAAIAVVALERDFGELIALDGVSFELPAGETLAVLGPNGAGKTTLLRILATLLRPSAGDVEVLGSSLPREAWRARGRIGYLGHEPLLYRDLTVAENLRFTANLHGIDDAGERIGGMLASVRLDRRADELVRNLSAGMLQRAAVCRALLHDPELLLLDEPRSHLDPEAAALVEPLIGPAARRTRVLVTHDIEAGLAEADRALVLGPRGAVAYEGAASGISAGDARSAFGGAP
jgi:heme exporter protein A